MVQILVEKKHQQSLVYADLLLSSCISKFVCGFTFDALKREDGLTVCTPGNIEAVAQSFPENPSALIRHRFQKANI